MSEFRAPVDIANRACQHCGVRRIDVAQGFTENSRNAREIASVYGKLRQAEFEDNTWVFSIRNAILRAIDDDTMKLAAAGWMSVTTYFVGMIVEYADLLWISRTPNSLGVEPGTGSDWQLYFGPMTVSLYDEDIAYTSGELVYTADGDGTNRVYMSLQDANEDDPATATAWSATVTYKKDDVVTRTSVAYLSLIDLNINQDPALAPDLYDEADTYAIGDEVGASDGLIYTSVTNGNIGNDPISDDGTNWTTAGVLNPWKSVFVGGTGSIKWRQIGGAEFPNGVTLETLDIVYPVGAGPSSQSNTRNVFHKPANYVKIAPQDPKEGSVSWLGAPTNPSYKDWNFQDEYIVTQEAGPFRLRFAADVADVTLMNAMFCEVLGARIGLAIDPILSQSKNIGTISQVYERFLWRAKRANAIEKGPVEDALDDWIECRA